MTREHDHSKAPHPRAISRREFIIQLAAMAGLLAACGPSEKPSPTATPPPTTQSLANALAPTATPPPTAVPTAGPTSTPTVRPIPPRPEIIKFYPDAPSKVVRARHAGV